ncbi:FAD-binding protein [Alteromonas gracilis]|uniref:FAD-binding protein n=1 Tax=Alteromonas gracilis TaxID=1479524 RepID=UPI0030CB4842
MSKSLIESVLSSKSVLVTNNDDVTPYHNSPEGFSSQVKGVIKIGDSADIQAVLALANQCSNTDEEFVVYPISTGNNWGYGSSVPPKDKRIQYLLDLSQLNDILFFDEKTGLCTIQPGVTQKILYDFLKEKSSDYMVLR